MSNRSKAREKKEKPKIRDFLKLYLKVPIPWWIWALVTFGYSTLVAVTFTKWVPPYTTKITSAANWTTPFVMTYVGLSLLRAVLFFLNKMVSNYAQNVTERDLRNLLYAKLLRSPMSYIGKERPSNMVSRIVSDTQGIYEYLSVLQSSWEGILTVFVVSGVIYELSPALFNIVLITVPVTVILKYLIGKFKYYFAKLIADTQADTVGNLTEKMGNIMLIKSICAEEEEIAVSIKLVMSQWYAFLKSAAFTTTYNVINAFAAQQLPLLLITINGVPLVENGSITKDDLNLIRLQFNSLIGSFQDISTLWTELKANQGSMYKIAEVVALGSEEMEREQTFSIPDADIAFKDVTFGYTDQREILKNVNFTIPTGKVTAIVGANGAGKTTIFNMLQRFYTPKSGQILFGDVDAEKIHLDEWRSAFSIVSQNSPLFSGTIRDNICYGLDRMPDEEELIKAAKLANAYDFIMRLEDQFDSQVGEGGGKVSGGERQRIGIARAIIMNPDFLLLDEATSSLDAQTESLIQGGIKNLMKNRTTVVIAHSMDTVKDADQIIVMDGGMVSGAGTYEELYKSNPIFKNFVDLQAV